MPKTIATTPSWYWPEGVPRVLGVPALAVPALAVDIAARRHPGALALAAAGTEVPAASLASLVAAVAGHVRRSVPDGGAVAVSAGPSAAGLVAVLGALASGRAVLLAPPGDRGASGVLAAGTAGAGLADADGMRVLADAGIDAVDVDAVAGAPGGEGPGGPDGGTGAAPLTAGALGDARVCLAGASGPVWHSHRSVLAGALALAAFFGPQPGDRWLLVQSPCSWDGLVTAVAALAAGAAVVAAGPGAGATDAAERYQPTWISASLDDAATTWSGGGGRRRRGQSATGRWLVTTVDGPFDPDERRAVGGAAGAGVLTLFGMAETGPVMAAHPSWYLDEPVGIPLPNMHLLPADPDTGEPIDVMWELLDHAMVSVWSPSLAVSGFEPGPGRPAGRRFVTGALAASDPNGMLYLVDG